MKRRELLAAGIVRDYQFANKHLFELHLMKLNGQHRRYEVLEKHECEDGRVLARIVEQYNDSPLIRLYEN